jgi:hypothetical protein
MICSAECVKKRQEKLGGGLFFSQAMTFKILKKNLTKFIVQ